MRVDPSLLCPWLLVACGGAAANAPAPDQDADDVPDVRDRCPLIPEDRDDFADFDGCPEGSPSQAELATYHGIVLPPRVASGAGPAASARAETTRPLDLPAEPSRHDVEAAMVTLDSAVRGCSSGVTGTAPFSVVFATSGRLSSVTVSGPPFAGTAAG